jgi:hypothetical protein
MSQYGWLPMVKFVPTDGIEEVLDLIAVGLRPTKIEPTHEPDITGRIDSNRRSNAKFYGFRPACKMTFEVIDTSLVSYLHLITNRVPANDVWTVYLALDNGVTYRQIDPASKLLTGPVAIQGKTFAGATYTLDLMAVDLIDQVPGLGTGVW